MDLSRIAIESGVPEKLDFAADMLDGTEPDARVPVPQTARTEHSELSLILPTPWFPSPTEWWGDSTQPDGIAAHAADATGASNPEQHDVDSGAVVARTLDREEDVGVHGMENAAASSAQQVQGSMVLVAWAALVATA